MCACVQVRACVCMWVGVNVSWGLLPGDGELRDVVEQVEHQHLHGSDGVEGKPHSRRQDGEGVAEGGAARKLDVLDGVACKKKEGWKRG